MLRGEQVHHLRNWNRAVADRTAHQPIAFVRELNAIVLEMDVSNIGRDAGVKVHRRFRDRKSVAGVDANADSARFLAERDKLGAAEILMILNRQHPPVVRDDRAILLRAPPARYP